MRIGAPGHPIYASERPEGRGVVINQSTSKILLTYDEARQLISALQELTK
ncbi:Uncharacterised protein [Mycobacteroides abscessus subsp. abscessus]|nr:Uncharacterised protein [Mycobacteroides abscessus subsp. abscessus]